MRLLYQASEKREEARKLETEAQKLETEGWGKLREDIVGSEVEGFYGLLRGVTSCSPPLSPPNHLCHNPHLSRPSPISPQPPQESTGPDVSDPVGQATASAPPPATSALGEDIPANMQPLRIQLGGSKQIYQCWVEGCKEGPSTSQAAVCAHIRKVHLGVGLVCPLCSKTFFNPDVFRHHRMAHY